MGHLKTSPYNDKTNNPLIIMKKKLLYRAFILLNFCAAGLLHSTSLSAQSAEPRIVDGTNTSPAHHPSYVTVMASGAMCGGTLIDRQWVLTAGHCLTNASGAPVNTSSIEIAIQPSGTTNEIVNAKEWVGASLFRLHPQYSFPKNDIALIKLKKSVSSRVTTLNDNNKDLIGMSGTVVGLGSTTRKLSGQVVIEKTPARLQQTTIPIIDISICNGYYSGGVPANLICAGNSGLRSSDACTGDSGGPLYIYRNGQKTQAGIVSFGSGCGVGAPNGYTDISKYKSFIKQYVANATFSGGGVSTISDVTGVWFDPNYNGVGFTIVQLPNNLSSIYYGYRRSGIPQWLISTSNYSDNVISGRTITLDMNTPTNNNGANFVTPPKTANSGTNYWGTVSFTFTGCNNAIATLTGSDGTVTYNIIRLQVPKAVNCIE